MPEYTPTTEQVREIWVDAVGDHPTPRLHAGGVFDRWLADHDAVVRNEALLTAAARIESFFPDPHAEGEGCDDCDAIRALAASLRELVEGEGQRPD
ncbi:hypothetical protein [Leifsonia aquatica]|uniref:hypothetical protein n=1 Tax=Leifsonia aquatica TaxID=144185 RepID=UPI0004695C49|nr:hypothetical protein [Leifsonia aquatica]